MKKAVFITNIPAHYRVAMLNVAYDILLSKGIELTVIFSRLTYARRKYWDIDTSKFKFKYRVLNKKDSITIGKNKLFEFGLGLKRNLSELKPDIVISGGFSLLSFNALRYSSKNNLPFVVYSGETNLTASQMRYMMLRNILRKFIVKRAKHFIVYGIKAKEYICGFGIYESDVTIAINSIDTDSFINKLQNSTIKKEGGKINILFVGDLIKYKGLEHLIKSLQIIDDGSFILTVVGGGNTESINDHINIGNIDFIKFAGKANYNQIHNYYNKADIFVLPSTFDSYGLVLVEAACAKLPLISTIYAGASYDIIEQGVNGFVINPFDYKDFSDKLSILIKDSRLRNKMGQESGKIIEKKVNINKSGEGFANGIINTLNGK
jgi:glycosyltransferase involved in cell wall biosynthesis